MRRIEVRAGWRKDQDRIGLIYIENARGKEIFSFSYDETWLVNNPEFVLDPDIAPISGRQYTPTDKPCFGFLSDISPDRWGRKLMERREVIDAKRESRPIRKLMESDYILGVHDKGRCGGIRLWDGAFLSDRKELVAPPMTDLRKLEQSSLKLEKATDPAEEKWFRDLIEPGSSLGGARPKANVCDENQELWIAKFPSVNDVFDVGAWEMVAWNLEKQVGITVPDATIMKLSDHGHTFLSKRFDREKDKRIHFASAMTMLGRTDNDSDLSGYADIVETIEQISADPEADLLELWKRMIFNICISNTDDHLRNHGFLLSDAGWRLAPAYDVNPSYDQERMSLLIGDDTEKSVENALEIADYFRLSGEEAKKKKHIRLKSTYSKIGKRQRRSTR